MEGKITDHQIKVDLNQLHRGLRHNPAGDSSDGDVRSAFSFTLCRKELLLGQLPIDQWWMSQRGLYGERNQDSPNRQEVVECYWSLCRREGSAVDDRSVQETYVLASLLPYARSNGSRRVFVDASLTRQRGGELARRQLLEELEALLQSARHDELDVLQFYRQTADLLGPPVYGEEVRSRHRALTAEILHEASDACALSGTEGLRLATEAWREKMRKIGRRRGLEVDKQALDALSYECRAAFHRCYSAAWLLLMEKLAGEYAWSDEAKLFHRLWHLDQVLPSNESPELRFHLFHGHLFGLHPAAGNLICTPTGRDLLGELLAAPPDLTCHRRFLNVMHLAAYQYAERYDVARLLRKGQVELTSDGDVESVAARQDGR
ncbi:MAG: hypothetical protein RIC55_34375 [Pirellulaceae bacterium]